MTKRRPSFFLLVVLAALLCALGAGCEAQHAPGSSYRQPAQPTKAALQRSANEAFQSGQYDRSELYYARLLEQPNLSQAERREAMERYARSGVEAGHYYQALRAHEDLAAFDPTERNQWSWQSGYVRALLGTNKTEAALDHLTRLVAAPPAGSFEIRSGAALQLSRVLRDRGDYAGSIKPLADAYHRAPDPKGRQQMEDDLFRDLDLLSQDSFHRLSAEADRSRSLNFPYSVIRLDGVRRIVRAEGPQAPAAQRAVQELRQSAELTDKRLLDEALKPSGYVAGTQAQPQQAAPVPQVVQAQPSAEAKPASRRVALALPLGGRDAAISWKILRGAWLVEKMLHQQGTDIQLMVVNTDTPDWPDRIHALPPEVQVVGGPLRIDLLGQLKAKNLNAERAFFAFLPGLGDLKEGADAWRFFPSPEDQVRSLVAMTVNDLGLHNLAVLYPQEKYGQRMAQIFTQEASNRGASVTSSEAYPASDSTQWGKSVAKMLGVPVKASGRNPVPPKTNFDAVFLPDSWSHAQMLVPQFFFYEEDRLVFLGPEIWGTANAASSDEIEANYFRLSVFPSAWWPENPAPATQALRKAMDGDGAGKPDFWVALGYDFVRFAAAMPAFTPSGGPASVNSAIQSAQNMDWSLAPITWDQSGVAKEPMFLFTPAKGSPGPADKDGLKARLQEAKDHHAERYASKPGQPQQKKE